jgi:hypothetical protein
MRIASIAVAVGAALTVGCPTPAPTPPTATTIYQELTEAGCYLVDEAGLPGVQQEMALGDAAPAWMKCLEKAGGTVTSCGVPCSP